MIRLRRSRAFGGGTAPIAFSTARIDAIACTVVQTPQMRCVNAQASRGIASLQDELDPAEHRRGRPRVLDDAAIDFGLDPKVPLDARDRIDDDAAHSGAPFSVGDDDAFGLGG